MSEISFEEGATKAGVKPSLFKNFIKNGKEISYHKVGRRNLVNSEDIDAWLVMRQDRKVELTKADFGTSRQRTFMGAVENWTQGALAEIALQKFIKRKFSVKLEIEFRVFDGIVVGQDIVAVIRGKTSNPPRIRVSVKSGKENGMVLIVPLNEGDTEARRSDYYVFVRVVFPVDVFARFYRSSPEFADMLNIIPDFEPATAYIVGYCKREELERRPVPEAGIDDEKYCKISGMLLNSDEHWRSFTDMI